MRKAATECREADGAAFFVMRGITLIEPGSGKGRAVPPWHEVLRRASAFKPRRKIEVDHYK